MIIRKRRVFVIFMIVIWLLGIIYFISDSGFLRNDPPKVGNYVIFLVGKHAPPSWRGMLCAMGKWDKRLFNEDNDLVKPDDCFYITRKIDW